MVAEEVFRVPEIERGPEKQPGHTCVPHFPEATIAGVDPAPNDGEPVSPDLLAQVVIFGKKNARVKPAKRIETRFLEQHKHAGAEGTVQAGEILKKIVGDVQGFIEQTAIAAKDVGSEAFQV